MAPFRNFKAPQINPWPLSLRVKHWVRLGIRHDSSSHEQRWHELTNTFVFWILGVVALYNALYILTQAWLPWILNTVVLVMIFVSLALLYYGFVAASRLVFIMSTAFGVATLAAALGPDSNLHYLAFFACLAAPMVMHRQKRSLQVLAFVFAAAAYWGGGALQNMMPLAPPFTPATRVIIEDICFLLCAGAIAFNITRLVDFLIESNDSREALLRALPEPFLRCTEDGHVLETSGASLEPWAPWLRVGGNSLANMLPPQSWLQVKQAILGAKSSRQTMTLRLALGRRHKEATKNQSDLESVPLPDKLFLDCRIRAQVDDQYVVLFRDQTEHVVAEEREREQHARMFHSARLATLGEMAAGVAHEINSPLAVIDTSAEALQRFFIKTGHGNEVTEKTITRIRKTVSRIAKIVEGLLSFSRDGAKIPSELVNVKHIVEDTLELCRQRFQNNGIQLKLEMPTDDIFVVCRPVQISQVLLNLLNNAFHATKPLQKRWVHLTISSSSDVPSCRIVVMDSGSGIDAKTQAKLFQPFFTTKPKGVGTGLGLSISRSIMDHHGGSLEYDGRQEHTCFVMSIPLARGLAHQAGAPDKATSAA
jgi:signal transduction histidine kinase